MASSQGGHPVGFTAVEHARAVAVAAAAALMIVLPTELGPRALEPLQRPLRIAQSWGLYGAGPNKAQVMEIVVDGVVRYRGGDAEVDWLASELRYRRLRPVPSHACRGGSPHVGALLAWVARRAREDFPGAERVEIRCLVGEWPGTDLRLGDHWETRAPAWEVGE